MATTATYLVTNLRTGFTEDGLLELQLIYDGGRGSSVWFQLTKAQQTKLDRDLWSRRDAERTGAGATPATARDAERTRSDPAPPQRQQQREKVDIGWNYWDTGE